MIAIARVEKSLNSLMPARREQKENAGEGEGKGMGKLMPARREQKENAGEGEGKGMGKGTANDYR